MPKRPDVPPVRRIPSPATQIVAPGVFVQETPTGPRFIGEEPTSVAAVVGHFGNGPMSQPIEVRSVADLEAQFGDGTATSAARAVRLFFENGGERTWVVRVPDGGGHTGLVDGMPALDAVHFNLLCIPDTAGLTGTDAASVIEAAERYVRERGAFLIADPPQGEDAASVISWLQDHGSLRSPDVAAYVPGVLTSGGADVVPASGAVAGVYARTDARRGVWKAPAGLEAVVMGITGLGLSIDDAASEAVVAAGLNPIRLARGMNVVWGARTMARVDGPDAEWKYVNVRRLFLFLQASIDKGTQWAVFEPNGEPLWRQLRASLEDFLEGLFRRGAFQGTKADEAFFVRCDRSTITESDIANGLAVVEIGFAPLKPAEFITIRLELKTADVPVAPAPSSSVRAQAVEAADAQRRAEGFGFNVVATGDGRNAAAIAEELATAAGTSLRRVDLRHVVSEFIGETEKNLVRLIDAAERGGWVLLFDEADALFGRRTQPGATLDAFWTRLDRHRRIVVWSTRRTDRLHPEVMLRARFVIDD